VLCSLVYPIKKPLSLSDGVYGNYPGPRICQKVTFRVAGLLCSANVQGRRHAISSPNEANCIERHEHLVSCRVRLKPLLVCDNKRYA